MNALSTIVALLFMLYGALGLICLAKEKHFSQLFNREAQPLMLKLLHAAGWLLLAISLVIALQIWPFGLALVAWFGALSLMQAAVVLVFAYHGAAFKLSAVASILLSLVATLSAFTLPGAA